MSAAQTETMAMGKAINAALADSLEEDPSIILSGEDIGQLGGVFRVTDGLQDRFGKDRVLDSPLAESAIVGTTVGMTYAGLRPVVEIQFDGFIYPAFDQIVAQVAKLQYRAGRSAPHADHDPCSNTWLCRYSFHYVLLGTCADQLELTIDADSAEVVIGRRNAIDQGFDLSTVHAFFEFNADAWLELGHNREGGFLIWRCRAG